MPQPPERSQPTCSMCHGLRPAHLPLQRIHASVPRRIPFLLTRTSPRLAPRMTNGADRIACEPLSLRLALRAHAGMAELVDAPDSKSGGVKPVRVRLPLPVPCRADSRRRLRWRLLRRDSHWDRQWTLRKQAQRAQNRSPALVGPNDQQRRVRCRVVTLEAQDRSMGYRGH